MVSTWIVSALFVKFLEICIIQHQLQRFLFSEVGELDNKGEETVCFWRLKFAVKL